MGDVNASDRIINIFSNNVIVYKQSTFAGPGTMAVAMQWRTLRA